MLSLSLQALKVSSEGDVDVGEENCYYNTAVEDTVNRCAAQIGFVWL